MKCKRFKIKNLRNEEWFQFYTAFKNLAERHNLTQMGIDELFVVFLNLYAQADEALEIIRKSVNTRPIGDADNNRDRTLRGLSDILKAAHNHFDADKREAARKVQIIFDHFGNMAILPNNQQTASVYNFLQEVRGICGDDIVLLGMTEWLDKLEAENIAFDELMDKRFAEMAGKTSLQIATVRKETDRCYLDMLNRIDAMILIMINSEQIYGKFVRELNEIVTLYKNRLAQREGINRVKREKEKQENNK